MISIVIPVFNRKEYTRDCLQSLRNQTNQQYKVIIVDDGSTDGTENMLREEFPEVEILKGSGSLFWTAGVNMGIRHALKQDAQLIMTMNNDVITDKHLLEKMYEWHEKKPAALLGALELDANTKQPIFGGERLNWLLNTIDEVLPTLSEDEQKGLHAVTHLPGRGLLIPRVVFEKIGLFDQDRFPHYIADYDYTHTARRAGFELYVNYDAKLLTYPEESGERQIRSEKNFKNYYKHLFDLKGGGNLRDFTRFTLKNCPKPYIPFHLANGYTRRLFGYFLR
ncbi:glycosyltransferase family 2 protein [Pontibacter sp. JH31]|uniref:Glycosyltransferase family 2 protein n=1 Tax=Pontibacter aquaedesilientis TaxID=2766980 RepID=A0ABR7XBE8_9BACT|nr:glycosyltransferase family 2 protein [Pontibacter aquaedesilientis]MBD1395624.1 glycosyltransferase family 2 protein [Pontibacter aquaedesilientis]